MSDEFGLNRLDRWVRATLPVASIVFLVLLSVTHLPIPIYATIAPALPLMGIYCWVVLRPDLTPRTAVFLLGLLQDVLTGFPLGIHALVYLAAHPVLLAQRRFFVRHSFLSFWWGFALLAPSASFLTWLLLSVLRGALFPPIGILAGLIAAILAFPVVAWIITRLRTALPATTDAASYA